MFQSRVEATNGIGVVALPLAALLAFFALLAAFTAPGMLPRFYLLHEDVFVLGGLVALLLLFSMTGGAAFQLPRAEAPLTMRKVQIGAAAGAVLLWAGTYLVFGNYPLSRDEQMVIFDMQVFRHWELAAPLAPGWRHYVQVAPEFLLPLPGNAAWVSFYMPVNAMLRTLFGAVFDPAALNPVLAAAGAIATFDCARRLFPDSRSTQAVAVLIYATSAQMLVTAMTPYAMTAHLAFNMIWLSFYLRNRRASHAAAVAVGFLAIGIHQIIFHPLFALPFIDQLRRRGQWRTAVAYLACYALFGLFWISYPHLVAMSAGLKSQAGPAAGTGGFIVGRIMPLLLHRQPMTIPLMEANLLRYVAWQNLALVPLMILGWKAVRRDDGVARPLVAGLVLTVLAIALLAPYQAIGWGYRYVHGLIGSCALLAAYGWRDVPDRAQLRAFVGAATLITVVGSIPFLTWQAAEFAAPYARVNRMIDGIDADMVVIDSEGPVFRIDEVRNRPDLSNRPIRLASHMLSHADVRALCNRGTVAFVDAGRMQALGLGFGNVPDPAAFNALRAAAPDRCRR